jgi:HD-GYP domain-containing protein (c-di-GMP phosphodiesterase class II)
MLKISINDVTPGVILDQDIFENKRSAMPLLCAGATVTAYFLFQLKRRGVEFLYAENPLVKEKPELPKGRNPLYGLNIPVKKSPPTVSPATKKEVLNIMKDFQISLSGLDTDNVCKLVNNLDDVLTRVLYEFPDNFSKPVNISQLRTDDVYSYLYRHALSVAVISMVIGQYLSFSHRDVVLLGKCASLHDIGTFFVPPDILNKDTFLTKDEYETVKRHTMLGYRCLAKMHIAEDDILNGILYHHERLDGSGYPLGLAREEIPLFSRIIAVADVYDAMTSQRHHRPAMTPADTCEFIMANTNKGFEYDIVAALLRRIEFYPIGTCVRLSSGDNAVVLDNNRHRLRPTVRIIDTDNTVDLSDKKYMNITILRAVSYQDVIERR